MDTIRTCPSCGKPVAADAPQGICPECLIKAGFGTASGTEGAGDAGFVPPAVDVLAPMFPQLEILELIGKGGMGAVYKARQPALDRLVALKILPPRAGNDPGFAERFTREARALAKLNHPNIVAVYDFGLTSGGRIPPAGAVGSFPSSTLATQAGNPLHYFIMEYVEGPNLRQLEQAGKLSPREALQIVPQICEALQYAHDEGVVHRDIKPENVLLDKKGRVKIADFGLAKILGREPQDFRLTARGQVMGTPHYMAPEQVEHPQEVDHRADIYSLGVVFYEMLTGELPLGKFAPPSTRTHGMQIDVRVDEVVLRALEREPGRRYQHASEVKTAVESIATGPAKGPASPATKAEGSGLRRRLKWALGVAGFGIAVGLGIWFLLSRSGGNALELTQEGWQLMHRGYLDRAVPTLERAVKLDPRSAEAWNGLGWARGHSGKFREAEQAFQKALALDPNHPGALNGLGQLYLMQQKNDLAESYLLKASKDAPMAWYGLAQFYLRQSKFDKAEQWAQKIIDSGYGDEHARQLLQAARSKQLPKEGPFIPNPALNPR